MITAPWMGGEPVPGEVFVSGHDPETARDLLAAAATLGHPALVVRTVRAGFIVPGDVHDLVTTTRAERAGMDF